MKFCVKEKYIVFMIDSSRMNPGHRFAFALIFFICALLVPGLTKLHAQVPCGNIIAPALTPPHQLVTTPIEDCDDPFNETTDLSSPYTLTIEGSIVEEGDTVTIPEGGTDNILIEGEPYLDFVDTMFFLHDDDNYRFKSLAPSSPTETDYRSLAEEFFPDGIDIELYIQARLTGDGQFDFDEEEEINLYVGFMNYVDENFIPEIPKLEAGTYTLVLKEGLLILTQRNIFEKFIDFLAPTAHAQTFPENIFTITFTLTEGEEVSAPSVFFIPGILSSNLYRDRGLSFEDQVWIPTGDQDVSQLEMDGNGVSANDIYTRDIVKQAGFKEIYESFVNYLNEQKEEGTILDWTPFAYDWRYDVFDIVENGTKYEDSMRFPAEELEELAENTNSKVTIIAHSNGGLLAKALLNKLKEEGKADLVERVIFLASPQLGTPESIGTILHGYDQEKLGGLVVNDETARTVMQNFPSVYGLIPSDEYGNGITDPFIIFSTSTSLTQMYRTAYGNSINSSNELFNFLIGDLDGRPNAIDVYMPSKANASMLLNARTYHQNTLDSWVAPDGVQIIEIVGMGLNTIKGFHYDKFTRKECLLGFINCQIKEYVKPVPFFTKLGDETVVGFSAEGYEEDKETYYFNLAEWNDENDDKYDHASIAESSQIQSLISSIVRNEEVDLSSISQVKPTFTDTHNIISVHSPIKIKVTDENGNVVERTGTSTSAEIKTEIPGSSYFEFAGGKYVIVPEGVDYTVDLEGEGEGTYTLKIEKVVNENHPQLLSKYELATVTPMMEASFTKENGLFSTIKSDLDGNGTIDSEVTIEGKPVIVVYTYKDLRAAINALSLPKNQKNLLLVEVLAAEKLAETRKKKKIFTVAEKIILLGIEQQVLQLKKKGSITQAQLENIIKIINSIRKS